MRFGDLFAWRRRRDVDLDEEIASHLAFATRDRVADGEAPRSAYLAARKEFGNVTLTREATRLSWGGLWIERTADAMRDVSYALRLLRRTPSYTFIVIAVLSVGIAANVIAFGLFKALALAPLAGVHDSGSLLFVGARTSAGQILPLSYPDYEDVRDRAFPGLAAWAIQPLIVGHGDQGRLTYAEFVSGNYFSVLGVGAQHGRPLTPTDVAPDGQPVVVIGDSLWRRSLGADPRIVGTTIRLNSQPMTVVGIAPPAFRGAVVGLATDVFVPITMQPRLIDHDNLESRDNRWVHAFMRPSNGMSRAQTDARAAGISRQLLQQYPRDFLVDRAFIVSLWRWPFGAQGMMLPAVGLMGAMAALLLAVVSANVAGLVLVRGLARRGETAARLALGASRARIVRQLMIENLVLTVPAALIGFLLPGLAEPFLGAAADNVSFPLYFNTGPDRLVAGFTFLVALVTAFIYGVVPAVRLSRVEVSLVLKDGLSPRGSSTGGLRTALVVGQVAVGLMLLVGTALVLRTFNAAQRADAGFDPRQVTWATFDVLAGGHDEASGRVLYDRLLDAIRAESGVTAASAATFLPLNLMDMMSWDADPEGYQRRPDESVSPPVNIVSDDYFRTMGIPLVAGREFDDRDADAIDPSLVVNETFAIRFFGSAEAAIGKRVGTNGRQATVVGVAQDVKYARLDESPRPYMYAPFSHFYSSGMTLQVRAAAEPAAVLERIRAHARALGAGMPVLASGVMGDQIRSASSLYETLARILVVIGVIAAALASLGVYGLVAYAIRQSAHEIGIRTALGATRGIILRRFLLRGVARAVVGIVIGILGALTLTRLMSGLLYGVTAVDLPSFAGASLLVLSAALVASFVPAWRGSRLDPVVVLRHQ